MTLIVGRVIEGRTRVVGDWKITYGPDDRRRGEQARDDQAHRTFVPSLLDGQLKVIAINPELAVAYSADVFDYALRAIRRAIIRASPLDAATLAALLSPATLDRSSEFLVADLSTIRIVGSGRVAVGSGAIGDQHAFSAYQTTYAIDPILKFESVGEVSATMYETADRMDRAFRTVVDDETFPSVAGFPVVLFARRSGFRYQSHVSGSGFQPVAGTTEPTSVLRSLGVEGGSYRYSFLVPSAPGVGAVGLHFVELGLGALFHPLLQDAPLEWCGVTADEFIQAVANEHGVRLDGPRWSPAGRTPLEKFNGS
jgi:hypothetical protein